MIGLVVIVDNIPQERIGEAMGQTTAGMTMGGLLGPVLGGLLYDSLGYYGVFVLPTALIILDITLRFAMIERSSAWLSALLYSLLTISSCETMARDFTG